MARAPAVACLALLVAALAAPGQEDPVNRIHYPHSDELEALLRSADAARLDGRWDQAAALYQAALEGDGAGNGGGYRLARWPGEEGGARRFKGVSEWAIEGLRALPPPGVAAFRRRFDLQAAARRDQARRANDPIRSLARVYELFPVASCAPEVREAMGDLALERGELARAGRSFAALLAHHAGELPDRGRIERKLALCQLGLLHPERLRLRGREAAQARVDAANRAWLDLALAPGRPAFAPRSFLDGAALDGSPRHLPLTDGRTAFVIGTERIRAWDLASGQEREIPRLSRHGWVELGSRGQQGGAIERGVLVAPQVEVVLEDQRFRGIPVKVRRAVRKLAGFELEGWRWRWDHARALRGTAREGWSWPAPPVCTDGVAFASAWEVRGFVNAHATAIDAATGELLWSTWVASGQVEQTMFGEQATEPLCVPPASEGGVVLHVSCLGSVAALEAETGRLLWVAEYDQIAVEAPRGFYAHERAIGWESNAPIVEAGVVVAAPLDSDWCYGFDAATGRRLWREARRQLAVDAEARWLFGAAEGRVVLAGDGEVRCLDVRTGKRVWSRALESDRVAGRGLLVRGAVCVPLEDGLLLLDLRTGAPGRRIPLAVTGNLALTSERLVVAGEGILAVHGNAR